MPVYEDSEARETLVCHITDDVVRKPWEIIIAVACDGHRTHLLPYLLAVACHYCESAH